jgi:hypothetical protein
VLAIRENLETIYPRAVRRYDTVDLTLEGALMQRRPGRDSRPAALELKILYDGDRLVTQARPTAPTYNTGKRSGTVRSLDGDKGLKYEAEVTITDDRWVPGGRGSWVINVQRDGERMIGSFEGQWKGEARKGTVTGVFTKGGLEEPIGDPPPETDLSRRCEEALERVTQIFVGRTFVSVSFTPREM